MLEKTYQPSEVEDRIYRAWVEARAFDCGRPERAKADPYCIVIPPPNVTGSLHMGHALNNTLQDVLCRFERMRGRDVLWQPGTDHAGIATQMVVERQLMERQLHRREMGREAFIKRVWEWKAESGGAITRQLKKLGCSCDWRRERFTMDEGLSAAVRKVFVDLYKAKLIYKDKRLVNWDPKLLTAISDLEVQQVETKGHLWYLKYPIEGAENEYIIVATVRPETMLGDVAVAVHPKNKRWKKLIGKTAILPLVGRRIPIIADEYADPEKGSGAVKITPAHDFNDYEVWRKHQKKELKGVEPINIFTPEAKLTLTHESFSAGPQAVTDFAAINALNGSERSKGRQLIVNFLDAKGFIEKIEPHVHKVPHGDRSGEVIEPYLTDQWYVDAKKLAKNAVAAVKQRRTKFVPKNWEKTYFDWLNKIEPWCISRQLWWGHRIPAWYGPKIELESGDTQAVAIKFESDPSNLEQAGNLERFVAETEEQALQMARDHYRCDVRIATDARDWASRKDGHIRIWRDPDVLDTWFSSALWPFSTLGWPEKTPELKRFYPTSVLVTGFDIIFFWVARMMMMGLHFMRAVPFRTVYIHALVRDERGAKMSKSKGNVIDPLSIIDDYGADALRFTLAAMAAQGRDIKLSESRVEGYRNFATKLWNAARFGEMNGARRDAKFDPKKAKETLNRWILGETAKAAAEVTKALEAYKFNEAAGAVYRFVWNVYCDWYLELAKPVLTGADGAAKDETRATVAFVLDEILKLLHPFMPFLTEELWQLTGRAGPKRDTMLALAPWPKLKGLADKKAEAEIGWIVDLVSAVRSVRSEMNIAASTLIPVALIGASSETHVRALNWSDAIQRLARTSGLIGLMNAVPPGSVQLVVRGEVVALPLSGVVDLAAERARLEKELGKIAGDIERVDKKLNNADFIANAPEEVVDEQRERREEAEERRAKVREALERLKGAA